MEYEISSKNVDEEDDQDCGTCKNCPRCVASAEENDILGERPFSRVIRELVKKHDVKQIRGYSSNIAAVLCQEIRSSTLYDVQGTMMQILVIGP